MPFSTLADIQVNVERILLQPDGAGSEELAPTTTSPPSPFVPIFTGMFARFTNTQPGMVKDQYQADNANDPVRLYCDALQFPDSSSGMTKGQKVNVSGVLSDGEHRISWRDPLGFIRYYEVTGFADMGNRQRITRIDAVERDKGWKTWEQR